MSEPGTFQDSFRAAAVPRWSHRDPVDGGNPFTPDDDQYPLWQAATHRAKDTLARADAAFELDQIPHPQPYPVRLVALAVGRFDVWSRRALEIVGSPHAVPDYERWLHDYRANWIRYVAETCPHVDVEDDLSVQLTARIRFWVDEAREKLQLS